VTEERSPNVAMAHPPVCRRSLRRHMALTVSEHGVVRGWNLLNLDRDYSPLAKELAWRAVARHPERAGEPWRMNACVEGPDVIRLEAHATAGNGRQDILGALSVPATTFGWMADSMARQLGIRAHYSYNLVPLDDHHELLNSWSELHHDSDFEVEAPADAALLLPDAFAAGAAPASRCLVPAAASPGLRCVFLKAAFEEFIHAARRESEMERSWAGEGKTYLSEDEVCSVVIEALRPIPGEAHREWIVTHGRDWDRMRTLVGDRLVAYLHLHPGRVNGQRIAPFPSANDRVVTWNVDLGCSRPCVFPIALFGDEEWEIPDRIAAFGYDRGALRQIPLEVTE
jgi:hypothetical protein